MYAIFALFCSCRLIGVFGDSVSVMEGDSVTLKTDFTKVTEGDDILWNFGSENILKVKQTNKQKQPFSTPDVPDERFRNRLKLDGQTGSLTIKDVTTEHAGDYEVVISGVKLRSKKFTVFVYGASVSPSLIALITFVVAGSLLFAVLFVIFSIYRKRRNNVEIEEDRADSIPCKPKTRKMKSKETVYANVE